MSDAVANTLIILGVIGVTMAPAILLVYARRKQRRPGGFVDYDPGLGRWNSFPAGANERGADFEEGNSLIVGDDFPDDDHLYDDDPVIRIRRKRRREG